MWLEIVEEMLESVLCIIRFEIIFFFMFFSKREEKNINNWFSNEGIVYYSYFIFFGEKII